MKRHRVFLALLTIVILSLLVIASTCDNDNGTDEPVSPTPAPASSILSKVPVQLRDSADVTGYIHL